MARTQPSAYAIARASVSSAHDDALRAIETMLDAYRELLGVSPEQWQLSVTREQVQGLLRHLADRAQREAHSL